MTLAYFKASLRAICVASLTFYPVASQAGDVGGAIVGGILGGIIGGAIINGMNQHHGSGEVRHHSSSSSSSSESNDRTLKIQQALAFFGFYHGTVDGRSGRGTREAESEYQKKLNHYPTGELTAEEFQSLLANYAEKTKAPPAITATTVPPAPQPQQNTGADGLFDAIARGYQPSGSGSVPTPAPATLQPTDPLIQANAQVPADLAPAATTPLLHYSSVCVGGMALKTATESDVTKTIKDHLCLWVAKSSQKTFQHLLDPKFADASVLADQCKSTTAAIKAEINPADAPDAIVAKLREKLKVYTDEQRAAALEGFEVCAGYGLSSNNLDFVQANAIGLAALNEPFYLGFVASQAALGIEERQNVVKGASWFDAAANMPPSLTQLAQPDAEREEAKAFYKKTAEDLRAGSPANLAAMQRVAGLVPNFSSGFKEPVGNPAPQLQLTPFTGTGKIDDTSKPKTMTRPELAEFIRPSIVIIYNPDKSATGTGYFISPTYILTNTHVVDGAGPRGVVVANGTLGVLAARVIAKGMTPDHQGIDAAIIEVVGKTSASYLRLNKSVREGQGIGIGGFPGVAQEGFDQSYDSFIHIILNNRVPTIDTIPSPKFDFGYVQALMTNSGDGMHNIQIGVNTAHGNSGSPIVDYCGNAIGLDYQVSLAQLPVVQTTSGQATAIGDSAHFSFAIRGDEVIKFLRTLNISYTETSATCAE